MSDDELIVEQMRPSDFPVVVEYFHSASREFLENLGVDPTRLPDEASWQDIYSAEYKREPTERKSHFLSWKADGAIVGFSSVNGIKFGCEAFMHLHVSQKENRRSGIGHRAIRKSVPIYFETFQLQRLFCEPNAFNTAPNRTLQRVGFSYVKTHRTVPSPINYHQPVTQWVFERSDLQRLVG